MGFPKKKSTDPMAERERALAAEIAALEAKIKSLTSGKPSPISAPQPAPKLRSTTLPHHAAMPAKAPVAVSGEPIFEEVDQSVLHTGRDPGRMSEEDRKRYFNELGVRKYDLVSLVRRVAGQFGGPAAPDSKLYKYLAVGSVQGLRPLRYEKRVARNRSLFVVAIIFVILVGATLYMTNRR